MPKETPDQALLFLETTIQIQRIIGEQATRDRIRRNVRNRRLCTSGHVLGEFNRTLIKDAITFRNLLRTSPSVEEAVKRLPRFVPPVSRKYPRTIELLAFLGFDGDKRATLERLEDFIEWRAYQHFRESIDDTCFADEVGCILRSWQPEQDQTGEYSLNGLKCLKASPPPCRVQDFIQKHRANLQEIVSKAKDHNRTNVAKAAEAFEGILEGQDTPFGERSNCYPISDTLIVLEAPSDSEIYSTDGDVHIICEILGRHRYREIPVDA